MQLNRNYGAKRHGDGDNHGPSFIVGLGAYAVGETWVMDESGDTDMPVMEAMRGWPQLKVGSMARGRKVSIHNRWFRFDSTVPHAVLPYQGNRLSIVYFTRSKYLVFGNHAMVVYSASPARRRATLSRGA